MRYFLCLLVLLAYSCQVEESEYHFLFSTVDSSSTGIEFSNNLVFTEEYNPYTFKNFLNGGGVAMGDINNDGLVDIYFTGNLVENTLYLNKGDFKFEDITSKANVACEAVWSTGAAFVDINHDGFLDLYVCKSGDPKSPNRSNELFINNGDLTFTEQAAAYGLDFVGLSVQTAFFDYDKDGDLDCYLLNNSIRSVGAYDIIQDQRLKPDPEGGNKLLKNLEVETGQITFKDVSLEAGIYTSAIGFGLGVSISDLNQDGWDDIFVSNDFFEKDYLYLNNQDGTFNEQSEAVFSELSTGSMGADIADLNNDGLPEIFVTEMLPEKLERYKSKTVFDSYDKVKLNESKGYHRQFGRNVLQYNQGIKDKIPQYFELGRYYGVEATDWSWGALMADFDNDGLKDIFVANGIFKDLLDQDQINFNSPQQISKMLKAKKENVILSIMNEIPSEPLPNYLFSQNEDNNFVASHPPKSKGFSNGSAYADLDNDGDLDLVVNNINEAATIYRNNSIDNSYLKLRLKGDKMNTKAIGTKVELYHEDKVYMLENHPMRGYQSCISNDLIFGLGLHSKVDSLVIIWPNKTVSSYQNISTDTTYTFDMVEGNAKQKSKSNTASIPLLKKVEGIIDYTHEEISFPDFDRNRMIPFKLSNSGPVGELGDLDNDGDLDLIISGYSRYGMQYFENTGASFKQKKLTAKDIPIYADKAEIMDINEDGLNDIVFLNGGFQHLKKSEEIEDGILINQKGIFENTSLNYQMSSVGVQQLDLNNDNAKELIFFPSIKVGAYGEPADGAAFTKQSDGYVQDQKLSIPLASLGMFTDVAYDQAQKEIVVASTYGPLKKFSSKQDGLQQDNSLPVDIKGMWRDIKLVDIDKDGDQDIIACNVGSNNRLYNLTDGKLFIYVADFDNNGRTDMVYCTQQNGKYYPIHLKDELLMQMPKLKKKSLKYNDYARISMEELFGDASGKIEAVVHEVNEWQSGIFVNQGIKGYSFQPLPKEVQYSEMRVACPIDLNSDGYLDLILGGNQYEAKPEYGINAASFGCVLINDKKGNFDFLDFEASGFFEKGQIRDILALDINGRKHILIFKNKERIEVYQLSGDTQ